MYKLAIIARFFLVVFLGLGLLFWIWPSISNRTIWLLAFWASLIASSLATLAKLPELFLGYLMTPHSRGAMFRRLVLVDFGSKSSSSQRFVVYIPLSLIFLVLAWIVGLLLYAVALVAFFLFLELHYWLQRITPPLVIYLGPSEPHDRLRSASLLSVTLVGKRLVTLLRPSESDLSPSLTRTLSYRTHDDLWVTMLGELLELARIIVIDIRSPTDIVLFELDRVLRSHLTYKMLVLVSDGQERELEDVLDIVTAERGACLTDLNILVSILQAFCHPTMRLPSVNQPIISLVADIRSLEAV